MANGVNINGGAPFQHYISGLRLVWVDGTHLEVSAGQCNDRANSSLLTVRTPLQLSPATVGPGGRDNTLPFSANNWYYVYVIAGVAVGVDVIASLTASGPELPDGFTTWRRIGSFRTQAAAAQIQAFVKLGAGRDRRTLWLGYDTFMNLILGGSATSETSVPLTNVLPGGDGTFYGNPTAVIISAELVAGIDAGMARFSELGWLTGGTFGFAKLAAPVDGQCVQNEIVIPLLDPRTQTMAYFVSAATLQLTLLAQGYLETL